MQHDPFSIAYFGPAVYVLTDTQGMNGDSEVVYVGMSEYDWPGRIAVHLRKNWGARICRVEIHPCKDRDAALSLENKLIRKHRPTYNTYLNFDD